MAIKEHQLIIAGAREHNLQGFDLTLPLGALIAVTGVSGSGKSSLAFDTLFREGQRRYLSTFSSFARLFLGKQARPAADHLFGLAPALAVGQRGATGGSGSTVGTATEIYDYLRLLYARLGQAHCVACKAPLASRSPTEIAALIQGRFAGQTIRLLAPVVDDHQGGRAALLQRLVEQGWTQARIDGAEVSLINAPQLKAEQRHDIQVITAQMEVCARNAAALETAVGKSFRLSGGALIVVRDNIQTRYQTGAACTACGAGFPHIGTRLFSFNSPHGACPDCKGLGVCDRVDPDLLVADSAKTLRQGAMVPTTPNGYIVYSQVTVDVMDQICREHGFNVDTPWCDLTPEQQRVIFYGSDRIQVPFGKHSLESRLKWSGITAKPREIGYYKGLIPVIEETLKRNRNPNILRFCTSAVCPSCRGARLRSEALAVTLGERHIAQTAALTLAELSAALHQAIQPNDPTAAPILAGIARRTAALVDLGLGYLTCDRPLNTLSGGEARRVRLAGQLGSGLSGLLHVLDEPSMGLHPHDRTGLFQVLERLRDEGNTVVIVEHDLESMARADWLVDIGPGAGRHGGKLLYSGPPQKVEVADASSITRAWLLGQTTTPIPSTRRTGWGRLRILGARQFNLKNIDVDFQLGAFNAVTGVSGAGKSTLTELLALSLRRDLHGARVQPGAFDGLEGAEALTKIIHVDQSPIGRTPRSNPATYTNLMDKIRDLFAREPEAKARGLKKSAFSMNVKGGRCETCQGAGVTVIGMHGLTDVAVTCEACNGRRFQETTLAVLHQGKSILDVLEMTVEEAHGFFKDTPTAARILDALMAVGLDYLTLGRASTTLSGGEAQRVKLAAELGRAAGERVLYVMDEPSAGLHPADVRLLLQALNRLVDKGHTVIVVEHHMDLIKTADWLVDLGPDGGEAGGHLVVAGTPETVAAHPQSRTGDVLAKILKAQPPVLARRALPVHQPQPIHMTGVTTHNLKAVDVSLPHGKLTVITGPSGSGKSSLAFDTLFREGRRRFAENLSTYARRLLADSGRPSLERVTGLTPTIAVGRERGARDPRSTVGTLSEIYEYLRLLYSRLGTPHCPQCDCQVTEAGCDDHGFSPKPMSASAFSFNHAAGACVECGGQGQVTVGDPEALINHPERSLFEGAMDGHKLARHYGDPNGKHLAILAAVGAAYGDDVHLPWREWRDAAQERALYGTGDQRYPVVWRFQNKTRSGEQKFQSTWPGLMGYLEEEYSRKLALGKASTLAQLMTQRVCPACGGGRLRPEPAAVRFEGLRIADLTAMSVRATHAFFQDYGQRAKGEKATISADIREEIMRRLAFLVTLGLDYLSLSRTAASLSGGELRRLRLAAQLGARLHGITYVLDEPTAGLHPRDTAKLIQLMRDLCGRGNTVVVIEHDEDVIRAADHLIDMGPGAGEAGGCIVAEGSPEVVAGKPDSATGRYLNSGCRLARPTQRRPGRGRLRLTGCDANNLKDVAVQVPLGAITVVIGVSGSGKSSLVFDCLGPSLAAGRPIHCRSIEADIDLPTLILMDQKPLTGSGLATPATWVKCFEPIRRIFAQTQTAKALKLKPTAFSFNSKGGRCETCSGTGQVKTDMGFLPDVTRTCEDCGGLRYGEAVLSCLYRGRSIADVLALSVTEALVLFAEEPAVAEPLGVLNRVGLGYLTLGRSTAGLSGGEAQRLKLAAELQRGERGGEGRIYLLDEPTTGLHFDDTAHVLALFHELADAGHTLVIAEHHRDVIAHGDHVIELGPEGGDAGGRVVYQGEPRR